MTNDDIQKELPKKSLPDDALPPVQAPGAGFILQLFVIPLVIVGIIVLVVFSFRWMAQVGNDPKDLVRGLSRGDDASWQKAVTLAELLRDPKMEHLKYDAALAASLADVFSEQSKSENALEQHQIKLRMFIARALGEFLIVEALPPLIEAAAADDRDRSKISKPDPDARKPRDLYEIDIRRAATEALAVLIQNLQAGGLDTLQSNEQLLDSLLKISQEYGDTDDEFLCAELRSAAAFALGVLGGQQATERLAKMLDDRSANVCYNAATGLARHGDERAVPVLNDMLDLNNEEVVEDELRESGKRFKRAMVVGNGIRASLRLFSVNPKADMSDIIRQLETIEQSELPEKSRLQAKEALMVLRKSAA